MYNLGNARTSCLERGRARSLRCLMLGEGVSSAGLGTGRFAARARLAQRPPPPIPPATVQPLCRKGQQLRSYAVAGKGRTRGHLDASGRQLCGAGPTPKTTPISEGPFRPERGQGVFFQPPPPLPLPRVTSLSEAPPTASAYPIQMPSWMAGRTLL
jgi:hypothetical protein